MTPDRYAKDYKLTETVDENGQTGFTYMYSGPLYAPVRNIKMSRQILTGTAAGWVCFIAALLPPSHAMHVIWISLPFVFTAIPLWMLARVVLLLKKAERGSCFLKKKEADLLTNTYPAAAMFTFVLPGLALIGQLAALAGRKWILPGDPVFTACAMILCIAGFCLFRLRPRTEKVKDAQTGKTE